MFETTIERPIKCSGIGLHSGRKVGLSFQPLPSGSGLVLGVQTDNGCSFVDITPENVVDTTLCTTLGQGRIRVGTVEHLMAAIRGLGIDNLLIEVDGPEVPIMDGSAASFVYLLNQAGVRTQKQLKKVYVLTEEVKVQDKNRWIRARPSSRFRVRYQVEFPHPMVGRQEIDFEPGRDDFVQDVARARTFGFLNDVEALQRKGLALGGSLDNALVFDQTGLINTEGFRYPDEPVRHKVLDLIGDIGLLPYPLLAEFDVSCSGHALNNAFARQILQAGTDCLRLMEGDRAAEIFPSAGAAVASVGQALTASS